MSKHALTAVSGAPVAGPEYGRRVEDAVRVRRED
jgi:hypothetical protein